MLCPTSQSISILAPGLPIHMVRAARDTVMVEPLAPAFDSGRDRHQRARDRAVIGHQHQLGAGHDEPESGSPTSSVSNLPLGRGLQALMPNLHLVHPRAQPIELNKLTTNRLPYGGLPGPSAEGPAARDGVGTTHKSASRPRKRALEGYMP